MFLLNACELRGGARAVGFACAILALGSCATQPAPPLAGASAADEAAPTPPLLYRSTIGAFASQRPVGPSAWASGARR